MSPVEELHALYAQWRQLTEEEGRAIEQGDWPQVDQAQSSKSLLQPRIVEVSERIEVAVHELQFRPVVEELMQLERRTRARLQELEQDARGRKQELDRSRRHLRQLHGSYVPPKRAHWQSYS